MLLQVQQAIAQAEAKFGPLNVVIANAGMPSSSEPSMPLLTKPSLCKIKNVWPIRISDSSIDSTYLTLFLFEELGRILQHLQRL